MAYARRPPPLPGARAAGGARRRRGRPAGGAATTPRARFAGRADPRRLAGARRGAGRRRRQRHGAELAAPRARRRRRQGRQAPVDREAGRAGRATTPAPWRTPRPRRGSWRSSGSTTGTSRRWRTPRGWWRQGAVGDGDHRAGQLPHRLRGLAERRPQLALPARRAAATACWATSPRTRSTSSGTCSGRLARSPASSRAHRARRAPPAAARRRRQPLRRGRPTSRGHAARWRTRTGWSPCSAPRGGAVVGLEASRASVGQQNAYGFELAGTRGGWRGTSAAPASCWSAARRR